MEFAQRRETKWGKARDRGQCRAIVVLCAALRCDLGCDAFVGALCLRTVLRHSRLASGKKVGAQGREKVAKARKPNW